LSTWEKKRKVIQSYDVTAEMYEERYAEEQYRKYKKALEKIDTRHKALLDVGCGSGLFFSQVAKQAKLIVGVDVSRQLLLKAKVHAKDFLNAYVVQADADHLPFKHGVFDNVFSFTVLQNMPEPKYTLEELKQIVKPAGSFLVTGLKKAFKLERFMDVLENSGLQIAAFMDDEDVNCYIAVLAVYGS
jgi:ubiquinone/menaquinone biosynthesis C-methylase UbiE